MGESSKQDQVSGRSSHWMCLGPRWAACCIPPALAFPHLASLSNRYVVLTVNVVNHLVSHTAIVLQDVVLLCASSNCDLLGNGKQLGQVLIWDIVQLGAVVLGDHKRMTLRDGTNVEESVRLVRVVQLERWDLAGDDLAKDAVGIGLERHLEQSTCGGEGEYDGRRWASCGMAGSGWLDREELVVIQEPVGLSPTDASRQLCVDPSGFPRRGAGTGTSGQVEDIRHQIAG